MKELVKKFYVKAFPTDDLGVEIKDSVTFEDVYNTLKNGDGEYVYDVIGVQDSLVRERIFGELSDRLGVDYDTVYDLWIGNTNECYKESFEYLSDEDQKKEAIEILKNSVSFDLVKSGEEDISYVKDQLTELMTDGHIDPDAYKYIMENFDSLTRSFIVTEDAKIADEKEEVKESLNESSMLMNEFSISDTEKLKVYWDKNDGYVVEKIYNQGNDLWRTDFKKTFHDELSAKRYFSRAKKKFGVNESVEDKLNIKVEVLVEPNFVDEKMVSGNIEDKYDDQTLEDWYDFASNVEGMVDRKFIVVNINMSKREDSLSEYIDFYKKDENGDKKEGVIDLRLSDHKSTQSARQNRKRKVSKIDKDYKLVSVIVNDKHFDSYDEALKHIEELLNKLNESLKEAFGQQEMTPNFDISLLDKWVADLTENEKTKYQEHPEFAEQYNYSLGGRYIKVFKEKDGKARSVFAFVDGDGNIYKPASWNAPAKGVRGRIENPPMEGRDLYRKYNESMKESKKINEATDNKAILDILGVTDNETLTQEDKDRYIRQFHELEKKGYDPSSIWLKSDYGTYINTKIVDETEDLVTVEYPTSEGVRESVDEGISGKMTPEEIAKKHNVSVEEINKQLEKGIEVEKEHTEDEKEAERIALDHLFEIPDYYARLDKMEKGALKEDTIKTKSGKWVNKGKEGTHGTFKTKKEADAQRAAMFANKKKGATWGESLKEDMKNQNKWEKIFDDYLKTIDFRLLKDKKGKFHLQDSQGANLGNIESDSFDNADEIIDRLGVYHEDYIISDIEELLDEYDIEHESVWDGTYGDLLKFRDKLPDYQFDFDVLDMIVNHGKDIDLENCDYEETDRDYKDEDDDTDESLKENYETLSGTKVTVFVDHDEAQEEANKRGLKLAEYGDYYDSKLAYAYWNKSGDRNDDEEVFAVYTFEKGKPRRLTREEAEYANAQYELGLDIDELYPIKVHIAYVITDEDENIIDSYDTAEEAIEIAIETPSAIFVEEVVSYDGDFDWDSAEVVWERDEDMNESKKLNESHSIVDKVNSFRKKYPKAVWFDNGKEVIIRETKENERRLKEFDLLDYAMYDEYNNYDVYVIDYSTEYDTLSAKNEAYRNYTRNDLYDALKYAYGFTKKECDNWIKKASEEAKQAIVDGFKDNARRSFYTESKNMYEGVNDKYKVEESVDEREVLSKVGSYEIIKDGYGFGIDDGTTVNRFFVDNDGVPHFDYEPTNKMIRKAIDKLVNSGKLDNPHYKGDDATYVGNTLKYGRGIEEDTAFIANEDQFKEINRICKKIGIEKVSDINHFKKEMGCENCSTEKLIELLREYEKELGDDFKIEESLDEIKIGELTANTYSVKDDSVRGFETKSREQVKVGDEVIIDNHFTKVVADDKVEECNLKESKEIDRKGFVSLVKLGEKPYDGYSILNDGYFVERIYAESDEDAIEQFRDRVEKKVVECNKTINIRESLNTIDNNTNNKYDLRNIYDCIALSENKKIEVAKLLTENADAEKIYNCLMEGIITEEDIDIRTIEKDETRTGNAFFHREPRTLEEIRTTREKHLEIDPDGVGDDYRVVKTITLDKNVDGIRELNRITKENVDEETSFGGTSYYDRNVIEIKTPEGRWLVDPLNYDYAVYAAFIDRE